MALDYPVNPSPQHTFFYSQYTTDVPVLARTFPLQTPWAVAVSGNLDSSPVNPGAVGTPIQHLLLVESPRLLIQWAP